MPIVAPCRVMAIGVFDSRKLDRFSRNSRIPTFVACIVLTLMCTQWYHNSRASGRAAPRPAPYSTNATAGRVSIHRAASCLQIVLVLISSTTHHLISRQSGLKSEHLPHHREGREAHD